MLYLYYGTDTTKARTTALALASSTGYMSTRFEADTFVPGSLRDAVKSVSLFGETFTYIIDTPSVNSDLWSEMIELIDVVKSADDIFIIIDGSLTAAQQKLIIPHTTRMEEFKKTTDTPFNTFALADALAHRDKKTLWILLLDAMKSGHSAEEVIGIMWWQLKSLRVAATTHTAGEADMKEYPYNKAKRALQNFQPGELEAISLRLLTVYHEGHGGEKDIWLGLEEWVLQI